MRRIGLTGGIASGKSTVSQMLKARGAEIIDADLIARDVVAPGTAGLKEIAARFPQVITADGQLDRQKLGALIFNDAEARTALNAITHPKIRQAVTARIEELVRQGTAIGIYDSPLLYENHLQSECDGVLVVYVDKATQLKRLRTRNGLSETEALQRMDSQMPLDEKRRLADWVIDNSGSLAETQAQVDVLWPRLLEGTS